MKAALGRGEYPTGKKVSDQAFKEIHLLRHALQGKWNYVVIPTANRSGWNDSVIA